MDKDKIIKIIKVVVMGYFGISYLVNWSIIFYQISKPEYSMTVMTAGLFFGSSLQLIIVYYLLFKCKYNLIKRLFKKQSQPIQHYTQKG